VGRLGLDLDGLAIERDECLRRGVAVQDDGHVNGDLLTASHEDQVGVLDEALDRVTLHLLRNRKLAVALELDGEQSIGCLEREQQVVARKCDVDRVGAVPVEYGGHLVVAADTPSCTLAERGAGLGP